MITITPSTILFSYSLEDIKTEAFMATSYIASNMFSKEGNDLSEMFILRKDESDIHQRLLKNTFSSISIIFSNLTSGITDAFKLGDTSAEIKINNTGTYDANILTSIEAKLFESIIKGIVYEFYMNKNNLDVAKSALENYNASNIALNKYVSMIKRGTFKSFLGNFWS